MIHIDRAFEPVVDKGDLLARDLERAICLPPEGEIIQAGAGLCALLAIGMDQTVGEGGIEICEREPTVSTIPQASCPSVRGRVMRRAIRGAQ